LKILKVEERNETLLIYNILTDGLFGLDEILVSAIYAPSIVWFWNALPGTVALWLDGGVGGSHEFDDTSI